LIEAITDSEEEESPGDERGTGSTVVEETPPGTPPDATQHVSTEGYVCLNCNPYVYNYATKTKELVQLSVC